MMTTVFLTYLIFHLKSTTKINKNFGTQYKSLLFLSILRYIEIERISKYIFFHILQGYIIFH